MEEDPGFPIFGYYLIDLNFDRIPELGAVSYTHLTLPTTERV